MSGNELIQQWKNPHARALDTGHPSGDITFDDHVVGAAAPKTQYFWSIGCCPTYTKSENCGGA
ncbi:hypothetical protein GCM10017673_42470 [Streptosporangium violaceochromogenes]|nr:hypothetical protein GCM10017673_42470 [Streptosporangium violaceochromogenes]